MGAGEAGMGDQDPEPSGRVTKDTPRDKLAVIAGLEVARPPSAPGISGLGSIGLRALSELVIIWMAS